MSPKKKMTREEEYEFYAAPENQVPQGEPRRRERLTEVVPVRFPGENHRRGTRSSRGRRAQRELVDPSGGEARARARHRMTHLHMLTMKRSTLLGGARAGLFLLAGLSHWFSCLARRGVEHACPVEHHLSHPRLP
ncbi:MAG: hypothetical protein U5R31_13345 [Acidimicrobiia bacterium]|nr:hypothetical protein [Acidimicrobiia bacterium]